MSQSVHWILYFHALLKVSTLFVLFKDIVLAKCPINIDISFNSSIDNSISILQEFFASSDKIFILGVRQRTIIP